MERKMVQTNGKCSMISSLHLTSHVVMHRFLVFQLASNFILSRVLMEVLQHLDRFSLPADLGEKLEEMVFGQLKNADP